MNLADVKWDSFFISGENGIFELRATNSGIDKNKLIESKNNNIPYITRSDHDNGLNLFVGEKQQTKYSIDPQNVITIGLDTQTVFYQPHKFYTGQNIQVLTNEYINKYNALFITRLLKQQLKKFNWGGNGATLGRLARTKIMLPVDEEGNPNYHFMEQYIKCDEKKKIDNYKQYINRTVGLMNYQDIISLENKHWEKFFIVDIFPEIKRGKRLTKANQQKGYIPYVSSTALNNGVDNFIEVKNNMRVYEDCLSVANSGSVGSSFYEPFKFVASDHVTHLKNTKFNKFIYLFIATITSRWSEKYNFNREINDERIKREIIILPVDEHGEPDYEYMEQYAKNMMIKKYNEYLQYLKK